jgi:hypothetical protein
MRSCRSQLARHAGRRRAKRAAAAVLASPASKIQRLSVEDPIQLSGWPGASSNSTDGSGRIGSSAELESESCGFEVLLLAAAAEEEGQERQQQQHALPQPLQPTSAARLSAGQPVPHQLQALLPQLAGCLRQGAAPHAPLPAPPAPAELLQQLVQQPHMLGCPRHPDIMTALLLPQQQPQIASSSAPPPQLPLLHIPVLARLLQQARQQQIAEQQVQQVQQLLDLLVRLPPGQQQELAQRLQNQAYR